MFFVGVEMQDNQEKGSKDKYKKIVLKQQIFLQGSLGVLHLHLFIIRIFDLFSMNYIVSSFIGTHRNAKNKICCQDAFGML